MPLNPNQRRTLTKSHPLDPPYIDFEGKRLLNFSGNDYLSLSNHPKMVEASIEAVKAFGTSSSASRVLSGTRPLHLEIEEQLKELLGKEAALLFNSGYQLNFSILSSSKTTHLFLDHNCHRSLIEGALHSKAKVIRFAHNNMEHLKKLLQKNPCKKPWIVTESLFSMDGDIAPLNELYEIKKEFDATLFVDDAHALGCMGPLGMGLGAHQDSIDILVGTFGKAFGSFGAFVATTKEIKEQLINFCPAFIYTTALPPAVLGSVDCALKLIPHMDEERAHLKAMSALLNGQSHIIPIPMETVDHALNKAEVLKEKGILVLPIRPPTVSLPILRCSLTSSHTIDQIENLIKHLI